MPKAPRTINSEKDKAPRPDYRTSSRERGYDQLWKKLRQRFITQHPICLFCWEKRKRSVPAQEVDHCIPFEGLTDPLRLDERNLRSLCRACHARKTQHDQEIRESYEHGMEIGQEREACLQMALESYWWKGA